MPTIKTSTGASAEAEREAIISPFQYDSVQITNHTCRSSLLSILYLFGPSQVSTLSVRGCRGCRLQPGVERSIENNDHWMRTISMYTVRQRTSTTTTVYAICPSTSLTASRLASSSFAGWRGAPWFPSPSWRSAPSLPSLSAPSSATSPSEPSSFQA